MSPCAASPTNEDDHVGPLAFISEGSDRVHRADHHAGRPGGRKNLWSNARRIRHHHHFDVAGSCGNPSACSCARSTPCRGWSHGRSTRQKIRTVAVAPAAGCGCTPGYYSALTMRAALHYFVGLLISSCTAHHAGNMSPPPKRAAICTSPASSPRAGDLSRQPEDLSL